MPSVTLPTRVTPAEIEERLRTVLAPRYKVFTQGQFLVLQQHLFKGCKVIIKDNGGTTVVDVNPGFPSRANMVAHMISLVALVWLALVGFWWVGAIVFLASALLRAFPSIAAAKEAAGALRAWRT